MATTNKATEFFVNGHHCKVESEHRAKYSGWLDGEQYTTGHSVQNVREEIIESAKWMVEVEPDFWKVCRAVDNFLQAQRDYNEGEYRWTHTDTVISQVTPGSSVGVAYTALMELESFACVEKGKIVMERNVEKMWRATSESGQVDFEEEQPENPWGQYES